MGTKSFRVAGLSSCYHTNETKEIFEKHLGENLTITELVTSAIVKYAEGKGFISPNGNKPEYIDDERFAEIVSVVDKRRKVDYTYLVAFEYLLSQHPGVSKSWIQRQAVLNFC